ncbi:hypothetical protein [Candidatus Thiosymbion oneisti]|uniref:hypothetical protein n=1 Tax=Candidatus Thiosymbion oneisti TaxID=589554 RepID=UPI001060F858|nr:hypothetical protein [Candidatus Thiosymbion oneisti]
MTIEQLEDAVLHLSPENLDRFAEWFEEFLADQWDKRIAADILAGRLDGVGERADKAFVAGHCTPL